MKAKKRKKSLNEIRTQEWMEARRLYPLELLFAVVAKRLLNNVHIAALRKEKKRTSTIVAMCNPHLMSANDLFRVRKVARMIGDAVKRGGVAFRVDVNEVLDKKKGELAAIEITAYAKEPGKKLGEVNVAPVRSFLRKLNSDKGLVGL